MEFMSSMEFIFHTAWRKNEKIVNNVCSPIKHFTLEKQEKKGEWQKEKKTKTKKNRELTKKMKDRG